MKIIYSEYYPTQLYNLDNDPGEQKNRAAEAEWSSTQQKLMDQVNHTWNLGALKQAVIDNQKVRQLLLRSLNQGRVQSWEHYPNPHRDSSRWVRHGDQFPEVERRGYIPYPAE